VQAFIDLCARHEHNLYKFIHEVHIHDNGLFEQLMGWVEGILLFLKQGPRGPDGALAALDMNKLLLRAMEHESIDEREAIREINALIKWQMARKRWHQAKTRQKMAAEGEDEATMVGSGTAVLGNAFRSSDFGINEADLADLDDDSSIDSTSTEDTEEDYSIADPIAAEQRRRARQADRLRRTAGEPVKPSVKELNKLMPDFLINLRQVLAK